MKFNPYVIALVCGLLTACGGGSDSYKVEGGGEPSTGNPPPDPPVEPEPEPATELLQKIVASDLVTATGANFTLPVHYTTAPETVDLAGLALRVHWSSQNLALSGMNQTYTNDLLGEGVETTDIDDLDDDPTTDKFLVISWADFPEGKWPNVTSWPVNLTNFQFEALQTGITQVNFSASSTAGGYSFKADTVKVTIE